MSHASRPYPQRSAGQRLHGLDALRAGMLLLGIVLHAAMSFIPADQYWVVRDNQPSDGIAGLYFSIHIFRMTAFFVIAGFFARMSFHRLGAGGFVGDRIRRIVVPLVVGWLVIIPGSWSVSHWAMGHSYGPEIYQTALATRPVLSPRMIPLQHLWFLYLLTIFYVLAIAGSGAMNKIDPGFRVGSLVHRAARRLIASPFAALALAAPATLALVMSPGWTMWSGIPASDRGLIPMPATVIAYGAAFTFGWAMHRQIDLLSVWRRWWWANLAVAVALTGVCLAVAGTEPKHAVAPYGVAKLAEAATYAITGWAWTFAAIGMSLRFLSGFSRARRYLADASYWMYLVHIPLVVALQAGVSHMPWAAPLKLLFVLGVTMPVLLVSYQLLVRNTFIGAFLNGRRLGQAPEPAPEAAAVAAPVVPTLPRIHR
jgi:peptidoglycan/LPS O-acetylase OafA/YrhL